MLWRLRSSWNHLPFTEDEIIKRKEVLGLTRRHRQMRKFLSNPSKRVLSLYFFKWIRHKRPCSISIIRGGFLTMKCCYTTLLHLINVTVTFIKTSYMSIPRICDNCLHLESNAFLMTRALNKNNRRRWI